MMEKTILIEIWFRLRYWPKVFANLASGFGIGPKSNNGFRRTLIALLATMVPGTLDDFLIMFDSE